MSTMHDFTGDYDLAVQEAYNESKRWLEVIADGEDRSYIKEKIQEAKIWWKGEFGEDKQGIADMYTFINAFNHYMSEAHKDLWM